MSLKSWEWHDKRLEKKVILKNINYGNILELIRLIVNSFFVVVGFFCFFYIIRHKKSIFSCLLTKTLDSVIKIISELVRNVRK